MVMRPYVICHIVSSVDGKIDGDWFGMEEIRPALAESNRIRENYQCSAVLYGSVTMAETYANGFVAELPAAAVTYPREDYLVQPEAELFFVSLDPAGKVAYQTGIIEKKGRKAHAVEILCEAVSDDYLHDLRAKGVSYLFAGQDSLDLQLALVKLKDLLKVERALICGGGMIDFSFLKAGLMDELSLVVAPVTDGGVQMPTVFDSSAFAAGEKIAFSLLGAEVLPGDSLWLRYQPKNRSKQEE